MQRRVTSYDIAGLSYRIPYNAWDRSQVFEHHNNRAMTSGGCDVVQSRTITHDSPTMVRDHQNLPIICRRMTS